MKKYKICVLTATRAEYGLLKPIICELCNKDLFDVRLAVTGMHLSREFGLTYKEIEADGIKIDRKIDILMSGDSTAAMAKTMGMATISFADYFAETKPDCLFAIADRYETLAVCIAAMCERIPIIHYMGGETSEGAIDECIRHSITKMSCLHFCCTNEYRNRIIQMGENPDYVYCVGSTGVENIKTLPLLDEKNIRNFLKVKDGRKYAVATFHPVTLEGNTAEEQILELLKACEVSNDVDFIFTKSNADASGRLINNLIENYVRNIENIRIYDSLGSFKYLSALKYAEFIIGNSSSGLLEAPSFKIPTINIGDRQKGRIRASSVVDCDPNMDAILKAMCSVKQQSFRKMCQNTKNPYEGRATSKTIADKIEEIILSNKFNLKKVFYNISVKKTLGNRKIEMDKYV